MKKPWKLLKSHHIYLGIGSLVAITALVLALTVGLSSVQAQGGQAACKEHQTFYPDAKVCMTLDVYKDWKAKK